MDVAIYYGNVDLHSYTLPFQPTLGVHNRRSAEGVHNRHSAEGMHGRRSVEGMHGRRSAEGMHGRRSVEGMHGRRSAEDVHSCIRHSAESIRCRTESMNGRRSAGMCGHRSSETVFSADGSSGYQSVHLDGKHGCVVKGK